MKVFISWSGRTSSQIAKILRDWLPSVIQAVRPFYSEDDIEKGVRGNTSMAQELEDSGFGILCLTSENLEAPWIMFEAGALSKELDTSRVCAVLFSSLKTTDLKGPLTQFQATIFNEQQMKKLLITLNKQLSEAALDPQVLDGVFEKFWPDLDERIQNVLSKSDETPEEVIRSDRELLEEMLTLMRRISPRFRTLTYQDALNFALNNLEESRPSVVTRNLMERGLTNTQAVIAVNYALGVLQKSNTDSGNQLEEQQLKAESDWDDEIP